MVRTNGEGKKYEVYADVMKVFKRNPNKLFQPREIRRALYSYNDTLVYEALSQLYCQGKLNKDLISGRKYYWVKR